MFVRAEQLIIKRCNPLASTSAPLSMITPGLVDCPGNEASHEATCIMFKPICPIPLGQRTSSQQSRNKGPRTGRTEVTTSVQVKRHWAQVDAEIVASRSSEHQFSGSPITKMRCKTRTAWPPGIISPSWTRRQVPPAGRVAQDLFSLKPAYGDTTYEVGSRHV